MAVEYIGCYFNVERSVRQMVDVLERNAAGKAFDRAKTEAEAREHLTKANTGTATNLKRLMARKGRRDQQAHTVSVTVTDYDAKPVALELVAENRELLTAKLRQASRTVVVAHSSDATFMWGSPKVLTDFFVGHPPRNHTRISLCCCNAGKLGEGDAIAGWATTFHRDLCVRTQRVYSVSARNGAVRVEKSGNTRVRAEGAVETYKVLIVGSVVDSQRVTETRLLKPSDKKTRTAQKGRKVSLVWACRCAAIAEPDPDANFCEDCGGLLKTD